MGTPQHIYGVFLPDGRWGMTRNKREAVKTAKKHGGEVRSIQAAGSERYWDAPTFRITSDHVWPNPLTKKHQYKMGDKVIYKGEVWEVGFVRGPNQSYAGSLRLQKGPSAYDEQVSIVYPEEVTPKRRKS